MSRYTDDPAADYDAYCREQEKAMENLPECAMCGDRIEDEFCYDAPWGIICEGCMEKYRKFTEDVVGE